MSTTALLTRPATTRHLRAVEDVTPVAAAAPTPAPAAPAAPAAGRPLPAGTAPRGFALYVGIDEAKAAADGISLSVLVEALRRTLGELAPHAETYATVALAPTGAGGRDVDVVRLALHEPSAVARTQQDEPDEDVAPGGVTVDISRKRVLIDGASAALTFKEFELLQYLVLREGRTIERTELVSSLWQGTTDDDAPGERTIDVHVRRLRSKLGRYEDIVRTVRGVGYRFDRHADVVIRYGHGSPSPDRF
ncbi:MULTISPECIES: winged helix-turn-helix domain-containing protein [unclassified Microbacterium]|uniref:winged helix-turn-helix domain-containing protein n=1 Tax=unclassified Microbacterium TaxID=2609290 RepID=UPI00214B8F32|nr:MULTISPECIES: winged helix-turn-helix domain-containing protein [unclassified Microbacterium]MCR2783678.1 winged helix-turn-helix domain-containing protein [Microbacterium sp. zg.B96]MDL5351522.1 winged helix-turn-helix domain-containing protein [Microbacterium sp. zg-YB36]WIM15465.1 winged helix-turn-helix domain-containing protein [Microbacterium sp. zg-B96]